MRDLCTEHTTDFNEDSTYCIMRRYNPELPFSFDKYVKVYKKERGLSFIERRVVLDDIFLNLETEKKFSFINFILYYFHKRKLNRKKVLDFEKYLDDNK